MRVTCLALLLLPGSLALGCGSSFSQDDPGAGAAGAGASGGAGATGGVGGGASGSGGTGGVLGFSACETPSDCVITPASCCGACGQASADDRVAVHRDRLADYRARACQGDVQCDACFGPADPYLVATCLQTGGGGQCAPIDLRATRATDCTRDTHCKVRLNTCCGCGVATADNVVALNSVAANQLDAQLCDSGEQCQECTQIPDLAGYGASCDQGQCVLITPPIASD